MPPDSKKAELESSYQEAFLCFFLSSDQEAFPFANKNTVRRSVSLQLFSKVWIFPRSLGVIYYDRFSLNVSLSLNQILLTRLLYVRRAWMTYSALTMSL